MRGLKIVAAVAAAGGVAMLAGCNTTSQRSTESDCLARYGTYSGAWSCARSQRYAGTSDQEWSRYVTTGDRVLTRVNAGQITEAQARASMSTGFSDGGFANGGRGRSGGGGGRR